MLKCHKCVVFSKQTVAPNKIKTARFGKNVLSVFLPQVFCFKEFL